MKLIFLYGLGQSAESWKEVQDFLADYPSEALDLFPSGIASYQEAKERIYQHLSKETEPFVLIGLSLGAALALELSSYDLPNLRALVLSGCPLKLAGNCSYPTLLICGSKDKLNLSSMKALHRLLTNSQFQIIPDGPHVLNEAKPKEFVEKIRSFLELLK